MSKYVAFLRGINVGGRIIKMADLKACFEGMSFKNVSTLLQSGNVIFESNTNQQKLKAKIEGGLTKTFNYPAKVQVFSLDNLKEITDAYPFDTSDEDFQHYVIFLEGNLAKDLASEDGELDGKIEKIKLGEGVVYWQVQKGMTLKSGRSKYLTKPKYKDFNTTRNIKTLKKIATAGNT